MFFILITSKQIAIGLLGSKICYFIKCLKDVIIICLTLMKCLCHPSYIHFSDFNFRTFFTIWRLWNRQIWLSRLYWRWSIHSYTGTANHPKSTLIMLSVVFYFLFCFFFYILYFILFHFGNSVVLRFWHKICFVTLYYSWSIKLRKSITSLDIISIIKTWQRVKFDF